MMKKYSFLFFFSFLLITKTYSQDFCAQKLNEAEDKFELGRFYEIPDMLSLCLNNGFTKEEKIRAYRLLTITYLYLDYNDKADETYLSLLNLSPEYRVNEEIDPQELLNHHEKFTTRPFIYLTVKAGVNLSDYFQINDFSLTTEEDGSEIIRRTVGYNFNAGAEFTILGNLHLGVEGSLIRKSFDYSDFQFAMKDDEGNVTDPGIETNMRQVYTFFEVPVFLKYSFYKPKISPFILAGVSPSYLFLANSINRTVDIRSEQISSEEPNEDITNFRERFNYSLLGGVGIKYKLGINYLTCEVRYQAGMLNYVKENERYNTSTRAGESFRFDLLYVDDDFALNNLSFLVGFTYPLYRPRKIKD